MKTRKYLKHFLFCIVAAIACTAGVVAGDLNLDTNPDFVEISGKRYVAVEKDGTVTFTVNPTQSLNSLDWKFANGDPSTGSGTGSQSVDYKAVAEGKKNDVKFTSKWTDSNNNTCTTTDKVTCTVIVPKIVPDSGQAGTTGDMVDSNKGATGEYHYVSPKKASSDVILTVEPSISSADFDKLYKWDGDGAAVSGSKHKWKVSRGTVKKNVVKLLRKVDNGEVAKINVWVVWSTISDSDIAINEIIIPDHGVVRGGYEFNATIEPATIITDADRPKLSGTKDTDPPGGNNICGSPLSGGATMHWDISRQIRAKIASTPNGWNNSDWLPPACINVDIANYPGNAIEGNDDAGTGDENNDPYNAPGKGKLISTDRPTRGVKHSAGALNDTIEVRLHFKEFTRLEINKKWYSISDPYLWRIHFKMKKVNILESAVNVDLNGDGDKNDTVAGWRDDGTFKDTTNNGW